MRLSPPLKVWFLNLFTPIAVFLINNRLNILFIKKCCPPVLAHGGIKWTYTEHYDGTIINGSPHPSGAAPSKPFDQKVRTPARILATGCEAMPSQEVIVLDEPPMTYTSPPLVARTSSPLVVRTGEGRYMPYLGIHSNLRQDLLKVGDDVEPDQPWEPCFRLKGVP